ncbi:adenosylcobinamide-GDP ribazoletransferase [Tritonibacter mobilis]|uniref:Adenosylcobinamide-GDP ribazoletransferase n=1 Tax=Tritonibacter mobilis F1926 TaxID=1265309 RepID=A0A1B1A3Q7_9RHOB|nr:adenosylcobinamide-GDP ribazoletransferase [Tritonibacter mobilis]ANP41195.1 adenosylcobinamide-GDP ribazoletransferase [Tritonibacter mobilis F1926]KJZ22889.1 cobalamin biosynthesis protein CobS [Tritonibacter mobilis]
MRKNDFKAIDLLLALVLLTRLPLPHLPKASFARQSRAVWAFPLAGAVVGLLAVIIAALALMWWPPAIAAGLTLAAQVTLTGAMHEDGLADTADGFWGGFEPARRLEIMKDSQIGTYGVLALILGLGLRWSILAALFSAGAIWTPVALAALSRAAMPVMMARMPNARGSGLAHTVGRPSLTATTFGILIALLLGVLCMGWAILGAALILVPLLIGLRKLAMAKIGGQTGDVLGTAQQLSEIALGLMLLALI